MATAPSSPSVSHRRGVTFAALDEVLNDVCRLAPSHVTVGHWTLGQICRHLADSLNGSIDGLDMRNHRWRRWFLRRAMLRHTLALGIPRGVTVDPKLTPPPNVNLRQAIEDLERAVRRYTSFSGRLAGHPLFGRMLRPMWDRFHCLHCAHHLSFVWPANAAPP